MPVQRIFLTASILVLSVSTSGRLTAHEAGISEISDRECGKAGLYMLLLMETSPSQAEKLDAHLSDPPETGYSMLELSDASRACGLILDPLEIGRDGAEIDRPMLALTSGSAGNHFVLMRPVQGRRAMVQIIDPRGASWIMLRDDIVSNPEWMGFVLRPRRASTWERRAEHAMIGAVVAGTTYAAGSVLAKSKRSQRRPST